MARLSHGERQTRYQRRYRINAPKPIRWTCRKVTMTKEEFDKMPEFHPGQRWFVDEASYIDPRVLAEAMKMPRRYGMSCTPPYLVGIDMGKGDDMAVEYPLTAKP
jgi:hypothetical protein